MEFEERLQNAIRRGQRRAEAQLRGQQEAALSEEELKRRHSQHQLALSDHIECCLARLPNHFPGFRFETVYGERGWGAACYRDDIRMAGGKRNNDYSRLEITVRPFSSLHVVDLAAKGAVRNKEVFHRSYFEKIEDVDLDKFLELVDAWVLEFAEIYAAKS